MNYFKDKKLINKLKWIVAILSFIYLVFSINKKLGQIDFSFFYSNSIFEKSKGFLLLFVLMILNWFLESVKWKYSLKNIQRISIRTAVSSVLAGISTGIFTPNRVGEFVGKIFFLKEEYREQAISTNIIVSYSQLLVTLILGACAVLFNQLSLLSLIILFLFFLYANLHKIINWCITKFNLTFLGKVETTKLNDLGVLFLLSLLRYSVFLIQFIVSLNLVGIKTELLNSIISIVTYYLYLAAIPTYAWSELGVRGALAVKVFESLSNNPLQTLTASSLLWIVNIALPALIGLIVLLKDKRA